MTPLFPADRTAKRKALLEAVAGIKATLESNAEEGDAQGTLNAASVGALTDSGLLGLKLPAVLGGAEADPVTQMEVIEAVSRVHPSAGWCLMIGATSVSLPGIFLPDSVLSQVFDGNRMPRAATAFMPKGTATPVDGGYRLSGRWSFASGIRHSEWLNAGVVLAPEGGAPSHHFFCFPTEQAEIHDNWQVLGLQGTGSCDFSANDIFVPQEFVWDSQATPPQRGGALGRLGIPSFIANEHVAFGLGVAQRALDIITEAASTSQRGFVPGPALLGSRSVFQRDLGQCDMKLQSARALSREIFEEAFDVVSAGNLLSPQLQAKTRTVGAYATDVAVEVVSTAFRYSGGSAIFLSGSLQRCLRDIESAAQHLLVSSASYENHAKFMLGHEDANPMA